MNRLIENISHYIDSLLQNNPSDFVYHNLQHTKDVADIVKDVAENSGIDEEEKELLLIAAWFHDTGYPESILQHELKSAEIAEEYLKSINFPFGKIATVKQLILSTKIPQNPKSLSEKIICDADIAYIGKNTFINRISLLRDEWKQTLKRKFTDYEWLKENINFIEANSFHTDYARNKFGDERKKNLALLKQKLADIKF
jgi:predicted metal-dependent HD superfamily phosphohydrolase